MDIGREDPCLHCEHVDDEHELDGPCEAEGCDCPQFEAEESASPLLGVDPPAWPPAGAHTGALHA